MSSGAPEPEVVPGVEAALDCLLVVPPHWYPYQPYLGLPALQGYLRQQGFSIRLVDLNLGCLDYHLTRPVLETTLAAAEERAFGPASGEVDEAFRRARQRLVRKAAVGAEIAFPKIEAALGILRGPLYYDYLRRAEALRVVQTAMLTTSARYFPTAYNPNNFSTRFNVFDPAELAELLANEDENPFLGYLEARLSPELVRLRPRAVGIGVTGSSQLVGGLSAARLVKKLAPGTHVVLGGSYFSRLVESVRRFPAVFSWVDSIIVNEGEIATAELLSRLRNGASLGDVPQRLWLAKRGEVAFNSAAAIPEADSLPAPDYQGVALDSYLAPVPILALATSRGCYWDRCKFCDHGFCYQHRYRERSIELVVQDLSTLERRWGIDKFEMIDEALEPRRVELVSRAIRDAGLEVEWFGLARIDRQFTPERLGLARSAGCRYLSFGVESNSDRTLRAMAKGSTAVLNERILTDCRKSDIRTHIMVFFGFPGESAEDARQTMDLIDRHDHLFHDASAAAFVIGRHSPILDEAERFGVELPPGWEQSAELAYTLDLPYRVQGVDTFAVAAANSTEFQRKTVRKKASLDRTMGFLYACHFGSADLPGILEDFGAHGRVPHLPDLQLTSSTDAPVAHDD